MPFFFFLSQPGSRAAALGQMIGFIVVGLFIVGSKVYLVAVKRCQRCSLCQFRRAWRLRRLLMLDVPDDAFAAPGRCAKCSEFDWDLVEWWNNRGKAGKK